MTTRKPPTLTILYVYCTGGTEMAQLHTRQPLSMCRQNSVGGRPKNSLPQEGTHTESTGCTSQVSRVQFPFSISSIFTSYNIYNSSLFQHEARVLSIKTWEGRMCFQDRFRSTCMATQAFKACLQYTKNSCFMLGFRCYEVKIELSPVCCHQYANTEGVREPERFNHV